jgi:hypothetical protein
MRLLSFLVNWWDVFHVEKINWWDLFHLEETESFCRKSDDIVSTSEMLHDFFQ